MHNMQLKRIISTALLGVAFHAVAAAKQPEFTLTPLTDPVLGVPADETREVQYQLINQSNKAHTLSMKPIAGVIQQTDKPGFCEHNINLKPGKSCILSLSIDGKETGILNKSGPLLCENASNWYDKEALASGVCVQPQSDSRLSIHTLPAGTPTFTVAVNTPQPYVKASARPPRHKCFARHSYKTAAGCILVLFKTTDTNADLQITNNSPTQFLTNVTATGYDPTQMTLDASNCVTVAPLGVCYLTFTLNPAANQVTVFPGVAVTVSASNTTSTSTITMQVLGIGDNYAGGLLFQLPVSGNGFNFYTASPADAQTTTLNWQPAVTACTTNAGDSLPEINTLQLLYNASNCALTPIANSVPITGFSCVTNPFYWSNTLGTSAGTSQAINFSTGATGALDQNGLPPAARARCVQALQLVPIPDA